MNESGTSMGGGQLSFASLLKSTPVLPEGSNPTLSFIKPVESGGRRGMLLQTEMIKRFENKWVETLLVHQLSKE